MQHIKRTIEIKVTTGIDTFYFPTDAVLNNHAKIIKIETFRAASVAKGPVTKSTVVADNVFNVASITILGQDSVEKISNVPLTLFNRADNYGIVEPLNISKINVTQSFIKVAETTNLVADTVFLLTIHYENV